MLVREIRFARAVMPVETGEGRRDGVMAGRILGEEFR